MPHNHHHHGGEHCSDEAHAHDHNDHGHDHGAESGPQDNLFSQIDREHVRVLNARGEAASGNGSIVIKPWDMRLDESKSLESDADDQLILRVPFVSSVKLRAILLKTGPGGQTPSKVQLYATDDSLDFEDVATTPPIQEFNVAQSREVGEYTVKAAKFSNVSCITLFFPASQGADSIQIYYLGFLGQWSKLNRSAPVVAVYEAQANPADHEKIQGMDGSFGAPQT